MTEEIKIKRKAGRPKGKGKPMSEAQKATMFKPGNTASLGTAIWSMKSETRTFKKKAAAILLSDSTMDAVVELMALLASTGRFSEFIQLHTHLANYAFGKPKEILETEDEIRQLSSGNENTPPLFGFIKGSLEEAEETDKDYV